jgi:hypothetical protein
MKQQLEENKSEFYFNYNVGKDFLTITRNPEATKPEENISNMYHG